MHILLLTQVLPYPPDSGPKIKTLNVLKYLAQRHTVTLISFVRGDQTAEAEALRRYCAEVHTVPITRRVLDDALALGHSLLTGQPWMMTRDDRAAMRRLVDDVAARTRFEVVHADQLNMAQYARRVPGAARLLDAHNALWVLYQRLEKTMPLGPRKALLMRDWRLLKTYEGAVVRDFEGVLAVSEEDRLALQQAANTTKAISVIPIAVDTDDLPVLTRHPQGDRLVHVGTMYWPPNIDGIHWFLEAVYPHIRTCRPQVMFDVVGSRPPESLTRLSAPAHGLNVTGYVPDTRPYLQQAGVYVVPLRAGGGMRVKILEALAHGMPLVTTSLGCEGIALRHGEHALIADDPRDFAQAVLSLLADPAQAATLGRNGRHLIETTYDYRQAYRPLDDLLAAITPHPPPPTNH